MQNHLFCFGLGYSALKLCETLLEEDWRISGTSRTMDKCESLRPLGITAHIFDSDIPLAFTETLSNATHILISIPPDNTGDIVLRHHMEELKSLSNLEWVGYLSTTGVYGNHDGAWVDETTEIAPPNQRSINRANAEKEWLASGLPVHIFRLSGIYGPGRSAAEAVQEGSARRIHKEGQVFSRIYVDDIVQILQKSIEKPNSGSIYACADDLPEAQEKVVEYAANLLKLPVPPLVNFEEAELSDMARSFYMNNRRVKNDKIKKELGVELKCPSYKNGIEQIAKNLYNSNIE